MVLLLAAWAAQPDVWKPDPTAEPVFRHGGDLVQVGDRVLDVELGTFSTQAVGSRPSPSGRAWAHLDDDALVVDGKRHLLLTFVTDPVATAWSWLSDEQILLMQRGRDGSVRCRVLDLPSAATTMPRAGCPKASFMALHGADRGPGELLAVYSAGEGVPGIDIIAWTPAAQKSVTLPKLDLASVPSGRVIFGPDDLALWIEAPCAACEVEGSTTVWKWSVGSGLLPVQGAVPPGVAYDPAHDRFAWVEKGKVCVGHSGAAICR
ncbi:MAG: hypothetical protein H6736_03960 [Alphaproteobacteria bacterium]|nr:hypothetical protein [Alphaproteobacteria bacterium]